MSYAISPAGLDLIKEHEGFRAEPAQLPDGNWVVGYGHVRVGEPGASVSEDEAAGLLALDLAPVERMVNAHVTARLSQSQFDALVSFAISVGAEAFVQSQVLRRVNNAEHIAAACALDAWRKADVNGDLEVVDALVRRRAAEKALYLKEMPQTSPSAFMRAKLDYAAAVLGAPVRFASAPAVGAAPVLPPQPAPAARLTEILKSEPATEALLLTTVVPQEAQAEDDEIATAHAKPAARKVADELESWVPPLPRDRRISRMRKRARFADALARFFAAPTLEVVGLAALLLFGLALTLVGGSLLHSSAGEWTDLAVAAAFAAPGLAAVLIAGVGFFRGAQSKSAHA